MGKIQRVRVSGMRCGISMRWQLGLGWCGEGWSRRWPWRYALAEVLRERGSKTLSYLDDY